MADPKRYQRGFSFGGYQSSNPAKPLPGATLDIELANVEQSLDEAISALGDIRRSDGQLRNGIVGRDALAPDLATGVRPATLWQTGIQYQAQDTVSVGAAFYRCLIGHTSGTVFANDVGAGRWELYAEIGGAATDAQTARNEAIAAASTASSASSAANASASTATAAANTAIATLDQFDDRYLGEKTALPTLDNDGNALVDGTLVSLTGQVPSTVNGMYVRRGGIWVPAAASTTGYFNWHRYVASSGQTVFSGADTNGRALAYAPGSVVVTVDGVTLSPDQYTATNGTSVVLTTGVVTGAVVVIFSWAQFSLADAYTKSQADSRFALVADRTAVLTQDLERYDRAYMRTVPSVSVWEPWAMAPDLIAWENQSGQRARVTEETVRERVRTEKRMGVRAIWLKYVEIFGHWFTKPAFTRWDDRDQVAGALTPPKYWHEFANNFSEFLADDFDFVGVVIDECAKQGMFVIIGLGRVGLFNTLNYYQTGTGGYTGPAALTQAAQMTLAIDRTRQLHDDIVTRFAAYQDSILALSSGFEPGDMPTWKVFSTGVTTGVGTHPTVKAKGYQWWVTPAQMAQLPAAGASLSTRATFAQDIRDCNADMWIVQDAVGPGNDYVNARYTYVASVTLGQLDDVYGRWRRSIDEAGRNIGFGTILEHWRMGFESPTNLTLSAVSGASVTVTSAFNYFTPALLNRYITGAAGGNGKIVTINSLTQAVLDTTVPATAQHAAGAAFSTTNLPQGTFSLNSGYADPYPAEPARVASQMAVHAKYSDEICMYGTSSFTVDSGLLLRLPQTLAGVFDYRTRAKALFDDATARFRAGLARQRGQRPRLPVRRVFQGSSATPTGGTYTVTQDRYAPAESYSRIFVRMRVTLFRGETVNAFVNDITLRLQIDGVNAGPSAFTGGKNGVCNGAVEILHEVTNTGNAFTFGLSATWQTGAGNPTISDVEWTIEELLR